MAMNEAAIEQVTESMRSAVRDYAVLVERLAGPKFIGLTVFGAVLDAGFDVARGPVDSVLVLEQTDLGLLRRLGEHGKRLGSKGIAAPLVMTPDYIAGSLDTFPLELLEIYQRRATVNGRDCFDGLEFAPQHVRLQCEREFKRVLIRLRQGVLAAAGREAVLGELRSDVGRHLLRTLRGLLWLKGIREFLAPGLVVTEAEKIAGASPGGIRNALLLHGEHDWAEYTALYSEVERLAGLADAM
jgi:hypothetical protein